MLYILYIPYIRYFIYLLLLLLHLLYLYKKMVILCGFSGATMPAFYCNKCNKNLLLLLGRVQQWASPLPLDCCLLQGIVAVRPGKFFTFFIKKT